MYRARLGVLDFSSFPETLSGFVPELIRIGGSKFVTDNEIRNGYLEKSHITQKADIIDVLRKN